MALKWGKAVTQVIVRPPKAGEGPHLWDKVQVAQPGLKAQSKPKQP
jgi:hypothetical protein